jgi:phage N-6-adenine-methyltransferase
MSQEMTIVLMDRAEAREKTDQIRSNLTQARRLLLEMYEREGWRALGYGSWREYGQAEFGYSERRIYQLMNAAKVEANVCTNVQNDTPIPESHLRPLTNLEPEQQQEVWQAAQASGERVTAKTVQETRDELYPPPSESSHVRDDESPEPPAERIPCQECGQEFEYDHWTICPRCRTDSTPPPDDGDQSFTLGFPYTCPAVDKVWHDAWVDGDCAACEHYGQKKGMHGCQHPERDPTPDLPAPPQPEQKPCSKCGTPFADDNWSICPDCREPVAADIDWFVGENSDLAATLSEQDGYDGDEWYTPQKWADLARELMCGITLDPASCEAANEVIKAAAFYDKSQDGLRYDWQGNVWLNPPYSDPAPWIVYLIACYEAHQVDQAVVLVNNATETRWFQALLSAYPACFLDKRISFWHPDRESESPRQAQVIFYLGAYIADFVTLFGDYGTVVQAM